MVDLELLRKFCVVAKYESFTKASNELYISQPALSKSIQKLENLLNIQLFDRNSKNIKLSKSGKTIYHLISDKMDYLCNIDAVVDSFLKKNYHHRLRIGANSSITREILTPILKKYMNTYQDIKISIENKNTNELISALKNKKLDLVLINLPADNIEDLEIIKYKEVHDVFIANENFQFLKGDKISIKQLQTIPIITYASDSIVRKNFQRYCASNNVFIKPHIEVTRTSLISNFCTLGLGIGFVTYEFIKQEIKKNNLFVLDMKEDIPKREVGILTRNEPKSKPVEDLINFFKDS